MTSGGHTPTSPIFQSVPCGKMAEMTEKEYKVYIKEVNWWSTTVTAACEEDAKQKAEEEHKTFEDYEEHGSNLTFLTETPNVYEGAGGAHKEKIAELEAQLAVENFSFT